MSKNISVECNYLTPLINLSFIELTSHETNEIEPALEYSLTDKKIILRRTLL